MRLSRLVASVIACGVIGMVSGTRAEDYPSRPIEVMVPFPPGGLGDLTIRLLQRTLTDDLKQPIVVNYKPGGGGTIAANVVKHAAPDGYTLLIANSSIMAINPSLMSSVTYDPIVDFTAIGMLVSTSHVLVVPAASPIKTFADLLSLARDNKKPMTFASSGIGGGGHLLGEMLKQKTADDLTHVAYNGAAPAMQDVLGGRIDFYFESVALALPYVASGGIRPLAVTSSHRLAAYPNVPTLTELGFADVNADSWFGVFAPAGVPATIVGRLNQAFGKALEEPAAVKALDAQSLDVLKSSPEALTKTLQIDLQRYGKLIKEIGAKLN